LNYVILYNLDSLFINSIEDLYIKSSFTDHLIMATNYTWVYNTQNINKREDYKFFKVNFESAGNLLSLYSKLVNKPKVEYVDSITNQQSAYYEVLNIRFAQYLKGDFEYRYGHMTNHVMSLVDGACFGLGVPSGHFDCRASG